MKKQNFNYSLAAFVSLLTFLLYFPSLHYYFIDWDDRAYVFENPYIRSLNITFFRWAFLDFYAANWYPLTWISHALDYAMWGLNPLGHHLTNILLHSLTSCLVVLLVVNLINIWRQRTQEHGATVFRTDQMAGITAGVTGLLFGLHPLHVESVAWIAERKDILCALFYLLSIMMYLRHVAREVYKSLQENARSLFVKWRYLLSLLFFSLALLSKPMAVTLPVVLLILDWYPLGKIRTIKTARTALLEKTPFIVFSLASSVVTIFAQKAGGAIRSADLASLGMRLLIAAQSLFTYLWKMLVPVNLLPFYPYPKNISPLSPEYLLPVLFVIAASAVCVAIAKRKPIWLAAWGYYVLTLLPVLGIVQVGSQSMADRYTYLPSLGPFLIMGLGVAWSWSKVNALGRMRAIVKLFSISAFMLLSTAMVYLAFEQIGIWKDSITLWSYVIEKEPESVPHAYYNRALAFDKLGHYDGALQDFGKAIVLNPGDVESFVNRGLLYLKTGQPELALSDLKRACELGDAFACGAPRYFLKDRP